MAATPTVEEILEKYPALKPYANNPENILTLYKELNPVRSIADLKEGDFVNGFDVLVVRVLGTSYYIGCPVCWNKAVDKEEGVSYDCPNQKCGTQRIATKLTKWTLLAGDATSKVVLDFPAFGYKLEDGNNLVAKVINIRGRVTSIRDQKQDGKVVGKTPVVMVKDMTIVSDIRDSIATPVPTLETAHVEEGTPVKTLTNDSVITTPQPPIQTTVPPDKLATFKKWMNFMAKPMPEQQVKNYVENNLKLKFEDLLPLMDSSYIDSQQTTIYRLKPNA